VVVRLDDPDMRDDECDRLVCVAQNALTGISLGGQTFFDKTRLMAGKYLPAVAPERRCLCVGQFAYDIPDFRARNTTKEC
jgi:hypothetical protein